MPVGKLMWARNSTEITQRSRRRSRLVDLPSAGECIGRCRVVLLSTHSGHFHRPHFDPGHYVGHLMVLQQHSGAGRDFDSRPMANRHSASCGTQPSGGGAQFSGKVRRQQGDRSSNLRSRIVNAEGCGRLSNALSASGARWAECQCVISPAEWPRTSTVDSARARRFRARKFSASP